MVALTPRFTILALFCSLAPLSLPTVSAAVLPARAQSTVSGHRASITHAASSSKPQREKSPTLALPVQQAVKPAKAVHKSKSDKKKGHKHEESKAKGDKKHGHGKRRVASWETWESPIHINTASNDQVPPFIDIPPVLQAKVGKRSLVISDRKGASYIVPNTPLSSRRRAYAKGYQRRDQDGVPGRIDIMSAVANSTTGQHIASLLMESNSSSSNASFVLNASESNQTQLYLVAAPTNAQEASNSDSDVPVSLQLDVYDASQASMVPFCATFNPNPPAPEPLTMESCFDSSGPVANKSQTFAYSKASGIIRPMWYLGQDDGKTDGKDTSDDSGDVAAQDPSTPSSADVASVTGMGNDQSASLANLKANIFVQDNSTSSDSTSPSDTPAQNVTLVFTPSGPEVPIQAEAIDSEDDSATTTTAFVTVTVSSTITASATVTTTITDGMANSDTTTASGSDSAMPSVTSVAVQDIDASPTDSSVGASITPASSSAPSTDTSSAASTATIALNVQVVGPDVSSSDSAAMSSATTSTDSADPTPTSSADADAIASSIADSELTDTDYDSSTVASTPSMTDSSATPSAMETSSVGSESVSLLPAMNAAAPTMTPVSTAPYEWMFTPRV